MKQNVKKHTKKKTPSSPRSKSKLTPVCVERGELGFLLGRAGAVGDLHLQLVPGGLLQVVQDVALGERGALGGGPGAGVHRPVLQDEGGDGAAAVVPAHQVELGPGGVDAGEELVILGKLWLCGGGRGRCYSRSLGKLSESRRGGKKNGCKRKTNKLKGILKFQVLGMDESEIIFSASQNGKR